MSTEANDPREHGDGPPASPLGTGERRAKLEREVLGYLNFSSGATDGAFLGAINELFEIEEEGPSGDRPSVDRVLAGLSKRLEELRAAGAPFADAEQALGVLRLTGQFRQAYGRFHADLLWGREPQELWRPLFLGRVFEALLTQGAPWDEAALNTARDRLDDYIGYRPIAVLETDQKIEPYRHEWVRPIPLYVAAARQNGASGVGVGRRKRLLERTLDLLRNTEPGILRAAHFDPELLEELALDPRAYDFDHPAHKRPNHHFGLWDPNRIDGSGMYRRFVLQPVVLNALCERVEQESGDRPDGSYARDELLDEAAAVLAGTILMASGVSGAGPTAHSGDDTLSILLPQIAAYRDRFYADLLARMTGDHGERLRREAERLRQPFAGARQHLNHAIARRRAEQLQRVRLARVYARMGASEAALEQANEVRVASSRILCKIYCKLTAGHQAIDGHELALAAELTPEIEDLLERGIECGALVDPWNIVGFGGNYSLFPSIENTIHDYRVDDLIQVVEQLLGLCARGWSEAAAIDDAEYERFFSSTLERIAIWWDQFATPMVSGVRRLLAKEIEVSTNLVAGALNAWHKAGAASGDIGFWGMFVDQFDSPKAFQQVVEALLEKGDLVASMALLMRWVCQVDLTPLDDGDASFHPLAERWLRLVEKRGEETGEDQWPLVAKFFDHLEANAEELWDAPKFELGKVHDDALFDELLEDDIDEEEESLGFEDAGEGDFDPEAPFDDEEDDEFGLFDAAYDDMTYEDTTDDGIDSAMYEPDSDETRLEFEDEAERLESRLSFLNTVSRLWKHAAVVWGVRVASPGGREETIAAWRKMAVRRGVQLAQLLETIHTHRLQPPDGDHESMVEYDQVRTIKDAILEGVITSCVEVADAARLLRAASGALADDDSPFTPRAVGAAVGVLRSVLRGDTAGVREHWPQLRTALASEELLYVPIGRGGEPRKIVRARALHRLISDLLGWFPRLGLIRETTELLGVAQQMETDHPVGRGAVTEYDRLFEAGYAAIVQCLVESSPTWGRAEDDAHAADVMLVEALQDLTETELGRWLGHSKTVRLSVVERLQDSREWERFVRFVERYGEDLFTQRFLTLSNLRAILHQRVGVWLDNLCEDPPQDAPKLIEEIDAGVPRDEAVRLLSIAIEAVVENYPIYRDYNATTTQSDHGEMLHALIDFLRLKNAYDRVAWNLKPVALAHRILVKSGRPAAAALWRRAVEERTCEAADQHQAGLEALTQRYGMRLPTVSQRLAERFVRPLTIDLVRSLVGPAMGTDPRIEASEAFSALRREVNSLLGDAAGSGLDLPDWVEALESEADEQQRKRRRGADSSNDPLRRIEQTQLSWEATQRQLTDEPEDEAE
ncbi:hypothetical protein MalM25_01510 [Planctomycetes bacterium MalM25]|nr:hypothetical protein MalM25_01510 [Planctomycetes bacterium MalM25]